MSAMMYDKSIFEKVKYEKINLAEDSWFIIQAKEEYGNVVVKMKNPNLFIYTKHDNSTWKNEYKGMGESKKEWAPVVKL